ncbi:hypothetical protein D3C76_1541120 [compost metagenome]
MAWSVDASTFIPGVLVSRSASSQLIFLSMVKCIFAKGYRSSVMLTDQSHVECHHFPGRFSDDAGKIKLRFCAFECHVHRLPVQPYRHTDVRVSL